MKTTSDAGFHRLAGQADKTIRVLQAINPEVLVKLIEVTTAILFLARLKKLWGKPLGDLVESGEAWANLYYRYQEEGHLTYFLVLPKGKELLVERLGFTDKDFDYLATIQSRRAGESNKTISCLLFEDREIRGDVICAITGQSRYRIISYRGLEAATLLLEDEKKGILNEWRALPRAVQDFLKATMTNTLKETLGI